MPKVYYNPKARAKELVAVTDQLNCRIAVFNPDYTDWDDENALVWAFYPENDAFLNCSDVKLRRLPQGGLAALMAASGGYAAVVRYPEGEILWQTTHTARNPHASEILPNGCFAVASSTGGEVRVYNTAASDEAYASVTLRAAHGVLWDPGLNLLWMLGFDLLLAFKVDIKDGLPVLTAAQEHTARLPAPCGHDLSPVYGNKDRLWFTAHGVYQYDKRAKIVLSDYEGAHLVNSPYVPSIGNMPGSGTLVRTVPNGTMHEWNTNEVDLFRQGRRVACKSQSGAYYKARVWCEEYQ